MITAYWTRLSSRRSTVSLLLSNKLWISTVIMFLINIKTMKAKMIRTSPANARRFTPRFQVPLMIKPSEDLAADDRGFASMIIVRIRISPKTVCSNTETFFAGLR